MIFLIIFAVALLLFFLLKPYFMRYNNLILFTGTLGSGKTFCAVQTALKILKKNRIKVWFHNLFHKEKQPRPLLYSNVPILVNPRTKEMSHKLKPEHFTMAEAIVPKSVVLTDEITLMLSQMDYKTVNDKPLSEMCSLFRQYTKNGTWICTTQSTAKCHHIVRRNLDTAYHLQDFRIFLGLFYVVKVRHIDVCEDVVNITEKHSENSTNRLFGLVPFKRRYDTFAFYPRYAKVPFAPKTYHSALSTKTLCKIPLKTKLPCYVDKDNNEIEE